MAAAKRQGKPSGYQIHYSPDTVEHLRALTAAQQSLLLPAIDNQLTHQEPEPVVSIRAVGIKVRNRVRIANEEFEL